MKKSTRKTRTRATKCQTNGTRCSVFPLAPFVTHAPATKPSLVFGDPTRRPGHIKTFLAT
ncbi:hypothetical protein M5D96_006400 [Drosophila gunungcola]|uniref:Uncharacterized protein n=1 Tax=Drosophila gunungcola TaxID=103775 RepID=A0A9Q0BPZ9_9MUSC|nr:hypothetical protein M5D96_006400 [Drosophila gunungcola]